MDRGECPKSKPLSGFARASRQTRCPHGAATIKSGQLKIPCTRSARVFALLSTSQFGSIVGAAQKPKMMKSLRTRASCKVCKFVAA